MNSSEKCDSPRRILLVSNRVMHYRVSVYNYFHRRFRESGLEFSVLADCLQEQNRRPLEFEFRERPFNFFAYTEEIDRLKPAAVILFLRLKDWIIWPLIHWLKMRGIPFALWTKGGNWDAKDSRLRYHLFNYVNGLSDALILYSKDCRSFIKPACQAKAFVANNTLNTEDFPRIEDTKEEIKRQFGIPFKKVVLFVGRMGAGKGRKRVDHLIDIFKDLDRQDIGLVIVGSGLSDELRARMNPRNTLYLGEVHDDRDLGIGKLFTMADVCAIPGHVGLGLNQAFHWGLPVITEECEHPPEIAYLKPGRNGFMVPHNDVASLRERILFLLDNDEVRAAFARNAREDIHADASIEGMFSGFKDCIQFLIQRTSSGAAQGVLHKPSAPQADGGAPDPLRIGEPGLQAK
jgi:glycosyltransferase involved in cell wall biosynthesis